MNIDDTLGPYRILGKVGEGGMGEVYRARDTKLKRDVALKVLPADVANDRDRLARFQREAEVLASLNHPHIAHIHGLEESGDTTALVMELVEGEDLSQRIARGPMPIDEALPIAKQIADALEAAHEQGIIHRDLKPANIKVRADGTVKVLDFGLAKALDTADGIRHTADGKANSPTVTSPAMTQAGIILGTAAYMSPEQAKGKAVDKRADIWAFGAVLYEMLAGRRAFQGEDVSDLLVAVLSKDVDLSALPPGTPPFVVRVIQSCLERDPKNRRRDIGDVRLELTAALSGGDAATRDAADTGSRPDSIRWKRVALASAAVSVALAVALALRVASPAAEPVTDAHVLRFKLVDNPTLRVNTTNTSPFTVSRDGSTIAFSGDSGTGTHLFVRTLDQPEPRMLAGTDGGLQPSISPNGEWIAFVVANHIIRKIRVGGGSVTTLASLDDLTAALAWASDDTVLFEKIGSTSGIHQVSANGGRPELLIPLAAGETGHRRPVVLRESRLVFYSTRGADGGPTLGAFSLDDGRRGRLEGNGIQALGMIAGHLVYARGDGALMAVLFDTRAIRAIGAPRQLDERVSTSAFGIAVTLSESGALVFSPPGLPLARLMLGDQEGRSLPIGDLVRAFEFPRFSPDGSRIAVAIAGTESRDLWVIDRASAAAVQVTRGEKGGIRLQGWMPDAKTLVYSRFDQLWATPVDGSAAPRQLVDVGAAALMGASVVPDGRSIVISRRMRSGTEGALDREELVRIALAGDATPQRLSAGTTSGSTMRVLDPRVSPDGRWVAVQDRNENQIHIRALEGGVGGQVSDACGELPVWGHDSARLFYQSSAGLMVADLQTRPALTVVRRRRAPSFPPASTIHDVSPDGKTFLLVAPVDPAAKVQVAVNWAADVRRQLQAVGGRP